MKKRLLTMVAGLMLTSVSVVASQPVILSDIGDHWAKESIFKAVHSGYVDGYDDQTFRPDNNVSRAEFIKLLASALKLPIGNLDGGEWFQPYVAATTKEGIFQNDFSSLNEPITRIEMAKLAVRAAKVRQGSEEATANDDQYMAAAVNAGLIHGVGIGQLAPEGKTTRAQSVTIIDRVQRINAGEKLEVDKRAAAAADLLVKRTNIFHVMPEFFGGQQWDKWDVAKLHIKTDDGNYEAIIDEIVAIDMANPNDPNLGLLGDPNDYVWSAFGKRHNLSWYPDSYVVVVNSRILRNDNPKKYVEGVNPSIGVYGLAESDYDAAADKGELNSVYPVYKINQRPVVGFVIPKSGFKTSGYLGIDATPKVYTGVQPTPTILVEVKALKEY